MRDVYYCFGLSGLLISKLYLTESEAVARADITQAEPPAETDLLSAHFNGTEWTLIERA